MYFAGLQEIIDSLFAADFEALGVVNDDGFIVFSFDGYPGVFLNDDAVSLNVRQKVTGDMSDYSNYDSASADGSEETIDGGSEDGVRMSETS